MKGRRIKNISAAFYYPGLPAVPQAPISLFLSFIYNTHDTVRTLHKGT